MLHSMKRLQIMIDEDLDEALARIALREGTSKAALIRRYVRGQVTSLLPIDSDPIGLMVGDEDLDREPIDETVYR